MCGKIYLLIRCITNFDYEREDILTYSTREELIKALCDEFEKTIDYELAKRPWLDHIEYRIQTVNGIDTTFEANQILKDFMEDLE